VTPWSVGFSLTVRMMSQLKLGSDSSAITERLAEWLGALCAWT
jgi:hypothetical protein